MLFLVSSLGIVMFLLVTAVAPFKGKVFSILYAKPISQALEGLSVPGVELTIEGVSEKKINVEAGASLSLSWKTTNVKSCIGRAWGNPEKDISWAGEKDPHGGTFQTMQLKKNSAYVYTIDCANEFADAPGDAVVINVGAKELSQAPYITAFEVKGSEGSTDKPIAFSIGEEVGIKWSNLNLNTPYSICFTTGSWPTQYLNSGKAEVSEKFVLNSPKVYRYSLYCSNEAGITGKVITLSPNP